MTHRANTVTVAMETDTYYLLTFNFCVRINFNFKKALKLMFSVFILKRKIVSQGNQNLKGTGKLHKHNEPEIESHICLIP